MELTGKVLFLIFTIIMWNYAGTLGKYDVWTLRVIAYIYMIVAVILGINT